MKKLFGSKELCRCLTKLGFAPGKQEGSSHIKYKIKLKNPVNNLRPFIVVQLGRKQYDRHSASSYLREIQRLGFTLEEIEKKLFD